MSSEVGSLLNMLHSFQARFGGPFCILPEPQSPYFCSLGHIRATMNNPGSHYKLMRAGETLRDLAPVEIITHRR